MNPKPIRIVFCLNGPSAVNGPNVWYTRHLPLLKQMGFDVRVLYVSWFPKMPCRFRGQLERDGIPYKTVGLGRFVEKNALDMARAAWKMKPDVFVPNYSAAGYVAARFLKEAGVKTIGTLHSDDPYYHDILDMFVQGDPMWRLSAVVSVSQFLTSEVQKSSPRIPLLHAPYGCPIPKKQAKWKKNDFEMIYCGRIEERQKQASKVAAAMMAAASKNVRGVFYGDGPTRKKIEEQIKKSRGKVQWKGVLKVNQVPHALAKGQAFVLLSKFEGFSIALMEAMASGLVPIISPMRSGLSDLINNGKNAFVVRANDTEKFKKRINELATNQALWEKMSANARNSIIENGYTSEACAQNWAKFLRRLCANKKPLAPKLIIPKDFNQQLPARSKRYQGINMEYRVWPIIPMKNAVKDKRPIYLWGASLGGRLVLRQMKAEKLSAVGFVDSNPAREGEKLCGLPIHSPACLKKNKAQRPLIVISSYYEEEISASLRKMGFKENEDYVMG